MFSDLHGSGPLGCWRFSCGRWAAKPFNNSRHQVPQGIIMKHKNTQRGVQEATRASQEPPTLSEEAPRGQKEIAKTPQGAEHHAHTRDINMF